ncbi:polysaccharide biosynthesis C-terminal domain-containing protein [Frisingicoccus sp.]|uniref:polysaccharide biosynthesis C-terminal domain-containing protein n=1 Tax=Frisingicoccus sp. TaxID=1918627 RepID=UPI003AB22D3D
MDKNRQRKLMLNSITSFLNQIITLVCGFILPKMILSSFGSSINGLVTSINQFLNVITFLDLGVGAVVTSELYRPLAEKDSDKISAIFVAAQSFFRKIALIFIVYISVLLFVYPTYVTADYGFWFVSSLILSISITLFSQYYFGIVYQLLLNADQSTYIVMVVQSVTLVINTIASIVLIKVGMSIQIVKLSTSVIFLARPIILGAYVKRKYQINRRIQYTGNPIKQKWNGLAQHAASVVLNNTDTIVLTMFSTLENVSVYGVYNLVVNGMRTLCSSFTAGISALFGNMIARNENELLNQTFDHFEWLIHTAITLLFTICAILIVPFVQVYTLGIEDANYIAPLFGVMIVLAQGIYCIRLPYNMMVLAAGHYKETQLSSIIEMMINIVISIIMVNKYGLVGVAIGTLAAMLYRTIYLAWYLSHNIINRKIILFIKHVLIDLLSIICIVFATRWICLGVLSYFNWIIMAIKVGIISLVISLLINIIFYRDNTIQMINKYKK